MLRAKVLLLVPVLALAFAGCGVDAVGPVSAPAGGTGGSTPGGGGGGGSPPTDTIPPSAPSGLAATTDGPFGTTVSWQASNDNVAVTDYRVERCQGTGCSNFVQVASLTGTNLIFHDTGLAAATDYSYRVRATDAVPNFSPYSNVDPVTTAATAPPPLAVLPSWVAALAVGAWFEIPNTAISSVEPSPVPAGNSGPRSKVGAWTSFVADTRTSQVYSVANGGHQDYSGNEVDVLDLEVEQPQWRQALAPTPNTQLTNCQSYYADGRPVSRHSYYGVTLDEFSDRIMLFGGALWCTGGGFHNAVSSYNIAGNSFNPAGTHPTSPPTSLGSYHAMTLNPLTGDVYQFPNGVVYKWTRATNSWSTPMPSNSLGGYEAMSAYDTTRNRILIVGGQSNAHHTYTPATNALLAITLAGANASSVASQIQGALTYVPAMDRFLARLGAAGGTVYQINPSTFEVTTFATSGGTSIPSISPGPYNKFLYVPRLRGAVYVPSYTGNAWFLRLH